MGFLVIINGPCGAGKTTIAKEIWNKFERTALINFDKLKWNISDFKEGMEDIIIANNVGFEMIKTYLKQDINVIIEKVFVRKSAIEKIINYSKRNQHKIILINLEAPLETLKQRVKERNPNRIKKMPMSKVEKVYNSCKENKYKVNLNFDTSKKSIKEIVDDILNFIQIQ